MQYSNIMTSGYTMFTTEILSPTEKLFTKQYPLVPSLIEDEVLSPNWQTDVSDTVYILQD